MEDKLEQEEEERQDENEEDEDVDGADKEEVWIDRMGVNLPIMGC